MQDGGISPPERPETLVLRSGRRLEVRSYGDPEGHPAFFFHGLIGSHNQASFIAGPARRLGLRIIAPNRPGVGRSEFILRRSPLEAVGDVEEVADSMGLGEFSVVGISGGSPYALATLARLGARVRTATLISGMGPTRLAGALDGMRRSDRIALAIGSRHRGLALREFRRWSTAYRADPDRFLRGFIARLVPADRLLFRDEGLRRVILGDLRELFVEGRGPESLAQELTLYRNYGFRLEDLPADRRVTLWHGLDDGLVPPSMAYRMARSLPNSEAHLVPGGHFIAVEIAGRVIERMKQLIDDPTGSPTPG